jgi:hypothetical protein
VLRQLRPFSLMVPGVGPAASADSREGAALARHILGSAAITQLASVTLSGAGHIWHDACSTVEEKEKVTKCPRTASFRGRS